MKQLILDEKKKRKRRNTSTTKFVRGPWFGFFPDWKKSMDIFNQNTEYNKPVEGEKADSDTPTPSDIISGETVSDGSGDASMTGNADGGSADGGMSGGDGGAGAGGI